MSKLWDLSHIQPLTEIVVDGETIPAMFRNAVARRGDAVFMRQKKLGLWRSWTWNQTAEAVREIAHGLIALGFEPHDCASVLSNTVIEWVLADLAVLSAGGVSNGIYPTDAPIQVMYLCADSKTRLLFVEDEEQLDKVLSVRAHLPDLHKVIVFARDEPGRTARAGACARGGACRRIALAHRCVPAGRPRDPRLHVGHHRPAQGRDAQPSRPGLHSARLQPDRSADRERRAHVLSAAVPHRRAHRRRVFRHLHRREAELRREPRHGAGERARDLTDRAQCRAAGVGEVLLGRCNLAARSEPAATQGLQLGALRRRAHRRTHAGRQAGRRVAEAAVPARALARARQRPQGDRHSPCARFVHRRGADLARPRALVSRARRADARGVGHDRNLRRRHLHAGAAHEAGNDRIGLPVQRGEARAANQ